MFFLKRSCIARQSHGKTVLNPLLQKWAQMLWGSSNSPFSCPSAPWKATPALKMCFSKKLKGAQRKRKLARQCEEKIEIPGTSPRPRHLWGKPQPSPWPWRPQLQNLPPLAWGTQPTRLLHGGCPPVMPTCCVNGVLLCNKINTVKCRGHVQLVSLLLWGTESRRVSLSAPEAAAGQLQAE